MTQTELLQEVLELIESAIKAGDWVVDGACDPDMTIHRIKEALAQQPAQHQEPVGAITVSHHKGLENHDFDYWGSLHDGTHNLYTSPPASKPLTDEEIGKILERGDIAERDAKNGRWHVLPYSFARAIEAAHGIKG